MFDRNNLTSIVHGLRILPVVFIDIYNNTFYLYTIPSSYSRSTSSYLFIANHFDSILFTLSIDSTMFASPK